MCHFSHHALVGHQKKWGIGNHAIELNVDIWILKHLPQCSHTRAKVYLSNIKYEVMEGHICNLFIFPIYHFIITVRALVLFQAVIAPLKEKKLLISRLLLLLIGAHLLARWVALSSITLSEQEFSLVARNSNILPLTVAMSPICSSFH